MGNTTSRDKIGKVTTVNVARAVDSEHYFTFRWDLKFENYHFIAEDTNIRSPSFVGGAESKHKWHMLMYPQKSYGDRYGEKYFELYLQLESAGKSKSGSLFGGGKGKVKLTYEIFLMDGNSVPLKGLKPETIGWHEYTTKNGGYGKEKLVSSYDIMLMLTRNNDDRLQIFCQFWIASKLDHESLFHLTQLTVRKAEQDQLMLSNVKSLLSNEILCDVELCTGNGSNVKKFKAHKSILACRSSVFATMFHTNMSESSTNIVLIPDFQEDIIEAMLLHIYGGTSDNLVELAPDLLQIADKYDIGSLKEECIDVITPTMNLVNAVSILKMASSFNAPILKRKALDLINGNKDKVMATDEFFSLSDELLAELYKAENEKYWK